ncbi:MAG: GNAT family N-acetyltransferase [Bacteroidia bacterium]|nr:GNAT family N-acetyltransferase [Bacteroidia bacterium]
MGKSNLRSAIQERKEVMYRIRETSDYIRLTYLFYDNGLEIEPGAESEHKVVKCWECITEADQTLIGAASLEMRAGEYVVADVAVDPIYRGLHIGVELMGEVEEEIKRRGGKKAWLVAKVPGFYTKLGWDIIERREAPDISKCFTCERYGKDCHPQIMMKNF